jgi:hypothetical protein
MKKKKKKRTFKVEKDVERLSARFQRRQQGSHWAIKEISTVCEKRKKKKKSTEKKKKKKKKKIKSVKIVDDQ